MKDANGRGHKKLFGSELIRAMENRGMNRAQFAAEIGATPNAVKKWEEGASFPKPEWWKSIRDVAGINPAEYGSRACNQSTTQDSPITFTGHQRAVGRVDKHLLR